MPFDVAIIGAGLSGLAAGIRLAHFGRKVVILERHSLWGGLNSFYKKGGHLFDVGLHAVTNWVRPGHRGARLPLQRLSRQLRIPIEEFDLVPQTRSSIRFDDASLTFTNDLEDLRESVGRLFPRELSGFDRLCEGCTEYPDPLVERPFLSARRRLAEYLTDPLLREMILCPLFYYGGASEEDLDWGEFVVLFNSLFREGLCRPRRGMRPFLRRLVDRYREAGGELWTNCAVERLVVTDGRVQRIVLAGGDVVDAEYVFSSAGARETRRLMGDATPTERPGRLAFVETVWVLSHPPWVDYEDCVTFFNRGESFAWRAPQDDLDLASGVLCCPNHYQGSVEPARTYLRATHLAHPGRWFELDPEKYPRHKAQGVRRSAERVAEIVGPFKDAVSYVDAFTPRTVHHYTGHDNGAIYGSPDKVRTGSLGPDNLALIGTDQGLVGIVGAMLSGASMANARLAG